jgi:SAM-dependent methyltransferase
MHGSVRSRFVSVLKRARARRYPWSRIAGRLARPKAGQRYVRSVDVEGWALSLDSVPVTVSVEVDGRPFASLSTDRPSPYLTSLYSDRVASGRAGFYVSIPARALGAGARISVRAEAPSPDGARGASHLSLGSVRVRRSETALAHSRGSYGAEWDRAATSLADARIAVCGTADPADYAQSGEATARAIREWCSVMPSDVVVEVGCGTGRVGAHLAPHCARWIGADVSRAMLEHAGRALADHANVEFRLLNGADLDVFDSGSADVLYSTGVFMHLDEWDRYRYVAEAFRVLRDGGRLYVDSMNLLGDEGWALFLQMAEYDPLNRPTRISKASTPEELRNYACRAGFGDVHVLPGPLWVTVVARKPASLSHGDAPRA